MPTARIAHLSDDRRRGVSHLRASAPRPRSPRVLLIVLGLCFAGCGGRSSLETFSETGGTSSSTAGTGGVGGTDTVGVGGTGVGGTDTVGVGGTGNGGTGNGGTFVGGSGGVLTPECGTSQIGLAGHVDGQVVNVTSDIFQGFGPTSGEPSTSYVLSFSDRGFLRLPAPYAEGTFPTKQTLLSLPPESPSPGLWLCDPSNEDVSVKTPDIGIDVAFELHDLRSLGACPGNPVGGMLDYCDPSGPGCPNGVISGQIGGVSVAPILDTEVSGPMDPEHLAGFYDHGMLALELPPSALGGTGVFVTPFNGPDPGAVYCIGKISPGADAYHYKLKDLSRLGSCAEAKQVGGALSVCFQW